jgi:hypothetical protein
MKHGDLVRICDLENNSFLRESIDINGYLWIADKPHHGAMPNVWSFRSVATGADLYAFQDRFERVEDETG